MNTEKCPTCGSQAKDTDVMRDWIWVRKCSEGLWFCSWHCLASYSAKASMGEDCADNDNERCN